ncbi:MAG: TonB-dependent receptor plug domain-containing protein [Fidelibacterota bacterium]|nr:MAG: TonB-dependent receptor plug domain-containing protein [Candidatus Neomarinimicrobiota bacterium]
MNKIGSQSIGRDIVLGLFLFLVVDLHAQLIIRGKVIDAETEAPLPGANILVSDTYDGGTTSDAGDFEFSTSETYPLTLSVSHIGYETRMILVTDNIPIVVELHPSAVPGEVITVEGAKPHIDRDLSAPVDIITLNDIETAATRDLEELLRPLAAIKVTTTQFGKQTVSIRGCNPEEVVIFLDGIPLNNAYTGAADLSVVDLNDIAQLEIVKGGSSILQAREALGGVINLTSRKPDGNHASYARGYGLTDSKDHDLSYSGSVRLGPFAGGGRYSGKSRLYDGRTLFTSLHKIATAGWYTGVGETMGKMLNLENYIEYPHGAIAQSDLTQLKGISFKGSQGFINGTHLAVSHRKWTWLDNFYNNRESNLKDQTEFYLASKELTMGLFEGTVQFEAQKQTFVGKATALTQGHQPQSTDDAHLDRRVQGLSIVAKWVGDPDHQAVDHIKWEAGFRRDAIRTYHDQETLVYTESHNEPIPSDDSIVDLSYHDRAQISRIGCQITGHLPNLEYDLFLGQGSNQRVPSLYDLFRYQEVSSNLRKEPLEPELFNSTNIGCQLKLPGFPDSPLVSGIEFRFDYFNNRYWQKIGYRQVPDSPPIPFNKNSAQISGSEIGAKVAWWDNRLAALADYQWISLSDPMLFPNKSQYRLIYQIDFKLPWLIVQYDYLREGPQYVVVNGWPATNLDKRQNANLNLTLRWQIWRLKITLAFTIWNLYNDDLPYADPTENVAVPFAYYEVRRELVMLKLDL